ncbi:iron ABC transporter [Salimicrobium jeotgali]|uniref:Iron ABC transporter n=2 Tax=Salimicrobium jeotgali TaxID=1230341 RepID=A0AAC9BEJ1_9BACI|nr:iron ABC transporter permease [Salimicrobium jeotgali]ANC70225.2 iron ABC transporter [Salimicrobium jeotgali]MBM7696423.1 iron complex transport system permease protein [Salimicrobium jeotgali]
MRIVTWISSVVLMLISFFIAMTFGAADSGLKEAWLSITGSSLDGTALILREIRLPREVAAMLVGAALSVSGAIMQGLTRNPLADPGLLGLTAGANAALAFTYAFFPDANYLGITFGSFIGAGVGMALVFGVGTMNKGGFSPFRIVLAGAAISAFLFGIAEGVSLIFKISKDVSMWTAGGLSGTSWGQVQILAPIVLPGIFVAMFFAKHLTIMSLNEELAIGLGQRVTRVKWALFVIIVLLAGAAVALVGNMAFLGLMIPHIVRPLIGHDYRNVLPASAIIGAGFMLIADTLARTVNAPYETPVAAIVSFIGLPFFLFIVQRKGQSFT